MAFQANDPGGSKRGYKRKSAPDSTNKKQPRRRGKSAPIPRAKTSKAVRMPKARRGAAPKYLST